MDLKVMSWNVEHFSGKGTGSRVDRLARVIDLIKGEDPDIFALMEVEGAMVFRDMVQAFPGYQFTITEGEQVQEILIGTRAGISAFTTQRNEFKRGKASLRPAALLTVTSSDTGNVISFLFSHLKSLPTPEGFGLRDAMFEKVRSLKKAIDNAVDLAGGARFVLLGDLNTMGMNLTFSRKDLTSAEEIVRVDKVLGRRDLIQQEMTHETTFNDGSDSTLPLTRLDMVYASPNVSFADMGGAPIRVAGWAEIDDVEEQDAWIDAFSDHAPLIFKVIDL
ncbi:MAG: endonuclease/exonuclease/phosphatase family protein [Pseudomonadota bacterium]